MFDLGKYGHDPENPEHTGAHDDDDCRDKGIAKGSGGGDGTVHKGREGIGKAHDAKPGHAGRDDLRIGRENAQKAWTGKGQGEAEHQSCAKGPGQRGEVGAQNACFLPCSVILTHETGTGNIKGIHGIVHDAVRIRCRGISGNHGGIKGIHAGLDEKIGNREDGGLKTRGQTKAKKGSGDVPVNAKMLLTQSAAFELLMHQGTDDQDGSKELRECACHGDAGHIPVTDQNKKQVEPDVENSG